MSGTSRPGTPEIAEYQSTLNQEVKEEVEEVEEVEEGEVDESKMEINSNIVYECGICYIELNIDNSVTTRCNHKFCNTCFFRWIESNATCPSCRAPIDSNTNLTHEQMQVEASEVYQDYQFHLSQYTRLLVQNSLLCSSVADAQRQLHTAQKLATDYMNRQIRLREMMDETRGYNEGFIAARVLLTEVDDDVDGDIILSSDIIAQHRKNESFMHGFYAGHYKETKRLEKFEKKMRFRIQKKKQKPKTLKDYGFTVIEKNKMSGEVKTVEV